MSTNRQYKKLTSSQINTKIFISLSSKKIVILVIMSTKTITLICYWKGKLSIAKKLFLMKVHNP